MDEKSTHQVLNRQLECKDQLCRQIISVGQLSFQSMTNNLSQLCVAFKSFRRCFIKSVILCRLIWVFFFFFGYVLHVQDLCEWRERQIPLFDLLSFAFLCYLFIYLFLFQEERDIKLEQKYLFTLNFNRGGLQISNGGNHRWVKCQN